MYCAYTWDLYGHFESFWYLLLRLWEKAVLLLWTWKVWQQFPWSAPWAQFGKDLECISTGLATFVLDPIAGHKLKVQFPYVDYRPKQPASWEHSAVERFIIVGFWWSCSIDSYAFHILRVKVGPQIWLIERFTLKDSQDISRQLKTMVEGWYLYHSLSCLDITIIRHILCATLAIFWSWSMFVTLGRALPKVLPPLQWLRLWLTYF